MNTNFRSSKGDILKGMMRRPETSKIIREAFNSPIGSTARQKAKRLINIMNKLQTAYDGGGGPGMPQEQAQDSYAQQPEASEYREVPKGMVILRKIPKPKITYGVKRDGAGGPGIFDSSKPFNMTPFDTLMNSINNKSSIASMGPMNMSLDPKTGLVSKPEATDITGAKPSSALTVSANLPWNNPAFNSPIKVPPGFSYTPQASTNNSYGISSSGGPSQSFSEWMASRVKPDLFLPPSDSSPSTMQNLPQSVQQSTQNTSQSTQNGPQSTQGGYTYQGKSYVAGTGPFAGDYKAVQSGDSGASSGDADDSWSKNWIGSTTGYGADVIPSFNGSRIMSSFTPEERQQIRDAQKTREASTLPNNPYGIKAGSLTNHWVDEGLAVIGGKASDGGNFLIFKDPQTADMAYDELLYGPAYSSLTLDQAMKKWSGYGPAKTGSISTDYSNLNNAATGAVKDNIGAGMFAYNNNKLPKPTAYDETIWNRYNIDTIRDKELEAFNEQDEMSNARNKYLLQTDSAINGFMNTMTSTWAGQSSNPGDIANSSAQLSYLYSLRGKENRSYLSYLDRAIEQSQTELSNLDKMYGTALNAYQKELETSNTITKDQYNLYMSALADMYTSVEGAPMKAAQLRLYEAQALSAEAQAAADSGKLAGQVSYLEDYPNIKKLDLLTNDGLAKIGTDLVAELGSLSQLAPEINGINVVKAYEQGVLSYLNSANEKNPTTGTGVDYAGKVKIAGEAIRNFANMSTAFADNSTMVNYASAAAENVAASIGKQVAEKIEGSSDKIQSSIKSLSSKGLFGYKKSPTQDEFVKSITADTGNAIDASMAAAIYAVFQRYVADGGTAEEWVNEKLNPNGYPITPVQLSYDVGNMYALSLLQDAFSL